MPFLTEELWHPVAAEGWGEVDCAGCVSGGEGRQLKDAAALVEFGLIQEVIQGLRTVRSEMKLDPKKKWWRSLRAQMGRRVGD